MMLKYVARRGWITSMIGLAITLTACKHGGGSGSGGGY
jgi:hypothetical protein